MLRGTTGLRGLAHIQTFGSTWGSNQPRSNSSVHRDLYRAASKKHVLLQQIEYTAARYDSLVKQLQELESREAYLFNLSAVQRGVSLVREAPGPEYQGRSARPH